MATQQMAAESSRRRRDKQIQWNEPVYNGHQRDWTKLNVIHR